VPLGLVTAPPLSLPGRVTLPTISGPPSPPLLAAGAGRSSSPSPGGGRDRLSSDRKPRAPRPPIVHHVPLMLRLIPDEPFTERPNGAVREIHQRDSLLTGIADRGRKNAEIPVRGDLATSRSIRPQVEVPSGSKAGWWTLPEAEHLRGGQRDVPEPEELGARRWPIPVAFHTTRPTGTWRTITVRSPVNAPGPVFRIVIRRRRTLPRRRRPTGSGPCRPMFLLQFAKASRHGRYAVKTGVGEPEMPRGGQHVLFDVSGWVCGRRWRFPRVSSC